VTNHRLAVAALGAILLGCSAPQQEPLRIGTYRGYLIRDPHGSSFRPCGEQQASPIEDRTSGELDRAFQGLAMGANGKLFVVLRGYTSGSSGTVIATDLRRAAPEGRGCAEDTAVFDFRASGNEPFWDLTISPSGMIFRRLDAEPVEFPFAEPASGQDAFRYHSSTASRRIEVALAEKRCIDSMAGSYFSYAAEVMVDGTVYHGCAIKGGE